MNFEQILFLVLGLVYAAALVIAGLLAWRYSKKHKPYMEIRDEYHAKWEEEKQNLDIKKLLTPIKVKMELPIGEKLFFLEDEVYTYLIDNKKRGYKEFDRASDGKISALESYLDDDDFTSMKANYKIKAANKKGFDYHGMLYVTNQRLMFQNANDYIQIPLNKVLKAYVAVIRIEDGYQTGYAIHTEDTLYQVVSTHPEVTVIINELVRYQLSKEEK